MKILTKIMKLYMPAACAVLALLLFAKLILPPFGIRIIYAMPFTEIFIFAAVSLGAVLSAVLRLMGDEPGFSAVILFPLTVAFWVIVVIIGNVWWIPLLSSAGAAVPFALGKSRFAAKALCGILAAMLSLPLFGLTTLSMIFGDVGVSTVVARADSPYSNMSAELIEIDTGALGVDYRIEVWENSADTDLGFAKITKERQSVPVQDYYRTEIQMEFKDEDTVVINGDKYKVG